MNFILDQIVDDFALPSLSSEWNTDEDIFKCKECGKTYKKVATLRKHRKEKHGPGKEKVQEYKCKYCGKVYKKLNYFTSHLEKKHSKEDDAISEIKAILSGTKNAYDVHIIDVSEMASLELTEKDNDMDQVLMYSRCALALGLFVLNFNDARKYGDGERVIRLYKFLYLIFRVDGRTKYAYYAFQLLCQVFYLLPEHLAFDLMFNRFTNNRGLLDSNVEIDREVEHWNKTFKMDCKEFNGKITPKSIQRASCSYQSVENILSTFDESTDIHRPSGRHENINTKADVISLAEQFKGHDLFKYKPGRTYGPYIVVPENLFSQIDVPLLKEWMISKIKHFSKLNVYSKL